MVKIYYMPVLKIALTIWTSQASLSLLQICIKSIDIKLLKISPGSIDAMLNLCNSLMEANQNKKALKISEKLMEPA